jgi:UDP-N-acetyl-D-mannosaminuronic acid dehydrogenase
MLKGESGVGQKKKKICVMGLGYIGLPTASLLGTKGYEVVGVDVTPDVVDTINAGHIHIVEPGLDILLKSAVNSGNMKASLEPEKADVFIIAVPTPFKGENHIPDMKFVESAVESIIPFVQKNNLIILESTSPVGTSDEIITPLLEKAGFRVGEDVYVAHCPERVLPGRILIELVENDRIVGGVDKESTKRAVGFYSDFVSGKVIATDAKTAEMAKLTENSFRDVNIAFANELSMICDKEGIDVWELIGLANRHPRVNILQPGPGVGGHCIAVDPWFIVDRTPELARIIRTAREVNDEKPDWVLKKVLSAAEKLKNPVIGCLGITYKPDVDDLRESPALDIVRKLIKSDVAEIKVTDAAVKHCPDIELLPLESVVESSDIILLLVNHSAYGELTAGLLKEKIVIDTRGVV